MKTDRTLPWDWYPGHVPENVFLDETAYCETTFSFHFLRSHHAQAVRYGRGASTYLGTMFDVGPEGRVKLGEFALVHGARIICDAEVTIGNYTLISWNVVLMDTYRLPFDREARRRELRRVPTRPVRTALGSAPGQPVRIEDNVWIGFDACILPGVTVGKGSIVGARSVVCCDVPRFSIAAGNPARIIRELTTEERSRLAPTDDVTTQPKNTST